VPYFEAITSCWRVSTMRENQVIIEKTMTITGIINMLSISVCPLEFFIG